MRFSNLPEIVQEAKDMIKGLKQMNFETFTRKTPDSTEMNDLLIELFELAEDAIKE